MFIELSQTYSNAHLGTANGGVGTTTQRFLMHFESGWEIYDNGNGKAHWANSTLGMNKSTDQSYEEIKARLIKAGLLIG